MRAINILSPAYWKTCVYNFLETFHHHTSVTPQLIFLYENCSALLNWLLELEMYLDWLR